MGLNISSSLSLPLDAVTQTFGCIGRKGAGKTYLAGVLAEQMLDKRAQVIVLDPVGNWWGLRVGADGKTKGKEIFVIGGEHGDVPISVDAGHRLAQVMVGKGISAVLDISGFRQGERKRFAADFAEEFFHLKKTQRSAVHLFVEEAQLFVPQRPGPEEARMLGAYENIIRLGRNYGIGATLISQRPQSVNKEVLSQVECLCVLQVNGTHERKALEEWVQEAGADRKLVGELPGLARGEGFVWSPSWLRIFERVRFAKKTTFDASATPEVGKSVEAARLSSVNVETLRSDLKEMVEKASENDPAVLKRQIAELRKELQAKPKPSTAKDRTAEIQQAYAHRLKWSISAVNELDDLIENNVMPLAPYLRFDAAKIKESVKRLRERIEQIGVTVSVDGHRVAPPIDIHFIQPKLIPQSEWPKPFIRQAETRSMRKLEDDGKGLRAGARRMLAALCQWMPAGRTEAQLAAQVQMKRTGGTWAAYKSDLRNGGYIQIRDGLWYATEAGREFLGADIPETPTTTDEVVRLWGEKLRLGARSMLDVLVNHRGRTVAREDLGRAVQMEHTGGTFSAYLSDLKQAGLIEVDRDGVRANRETLFL